MTEVLGITIEETNSMNPVALQGFVEMQLSRIFPSNSAVYASLLTYSGAAKALAEEMTELESLPFEGAETKTRWIVRENPGSNSKVSSHLLSLLEKQHIDVMEPSSALKRLNKLILDTLLEDGYRVSSKTPILNMLIFLEDRVTKSDTSLNGGKKGAFLNSCTAINSVYLDYSYKKITESGDISSLNTIAKAVDLLACACPVSFPVMPPKLFSNYFPSIRSISSVLEILTPEQLKMLEEEVKERSTKNPDRERGIGRDSKTRKAVRGSLVRILEDSPHTATRFVYTGDSKLRNSDPILASFAHNESSIYEFLFKVLVGETHGKQLDNYSSLLIPQRALDEQHKRNFFPVSLAREYSALRAFYEHPEILKDKALNSSEMRFIRSILGLI